jgi:hypothetical protein
MVCYKSLTPFILPKERNFIPKLKELEQRIFELIVLAKHLVSNITLGLLWISCIASEDYPMNVVRKIGRKDT